MNFFSKNSTLAFINATLTDEEVALDMIEDDSSAEHIYACLLLQRVFFFLFATLVMLACVFSTSAISVCTQFFFLFIFLFELPRSSKEREREKNQDFSQGERDARAT